MNKKLYNLILILLLIIFSGCSKKKKDLDFVIQIEPHGIKKQPAQIGIYKDGRFSLIAKTNKEIEFDVWKPRYSFDKNKVVYFRQKKNILKNFDKHIMCLHNIQTDIINRKAFNALPDNLMRADYEFIDKERIISIGIVNVDGVRHDALYLYNFKTNEKEIIEKWNAKKHTILDIAVSSNKKFAITDFRIKGDAKKYILKIDLKTKKVEYIDTGKYSLMDIAVMPDNETLLCAGFLPKEEGRPFREKAIFFYNLNTKKIKGLVRNVGTTTRIELMPGAKEFVYYAGGRDGDFKIHNIKTGKERSFRREFGLSDDIGYINRMDFYDPK